MTTLDTIAQNSASAVRLSVSGVRVPLAGVAGAAQVAAMWRMAGYAVAGATVGAAAVFVLFFTGAAPDDPAQNIVPTTDAVVATTVPATPVPPTTAPPAPAEEPPPVAAVPGETGGESAPEPVDVEAPMLEVISPTDGERFESKVVTFSGRTEPGALVIASGKFPASVDGDGLWSVDLVLAPGANGVVFRATDAAGNQSEVRLTVYLDVETPKETTTTTAAEWLFTANQQYGSCAEPLPYDVFSGKAKPGTTVTISSPHGGGAVVVDGNGKWSTRIEFPSAPYNMQFTVTVKDYTGATKTFAFISLYEG